LSTLIKNYIFSIFLFYYLSKLVKLLQIGNHQSIKKTPNDFKILKSRTNNKEKILIEPVESSKNTKVEVFALTQSKETKNKKNLLKSKQNSSFVIHSP
jgi:hypothetical protein